MVWPPEPCAEEIPEPAENPELAEDPELAEAPEPSSDPEELPSSGPEELPSSDPGERDEPAEVPEPLGAAALPEEPVVLACDDPGSA